MASYCDATPGLEYKFTLRCLVKVHASQFQEDLAELLADVSKEGGQLDRLTCGATGACPPSELDPLPLVNNVSLSDGIVFTPQNGRWLDGYCGI